MSSMLIALVAALGLAASAARAGEPIPVGGSAWTTTGTLKAAVKVQGHAAKQEFEVGATLEFGPVDLLPNQFRLTVDGEFPFEIVGTYDESTPGKPSFDDLGNEVLAALGLLPVPGLELSDLSSQIKAKPQLKDGVETIKIAFKIKVKLSIEGQSMDMAIGYKGEGTRVLQ